MRDYRHRDTWAALYKMWRGGRASRRRVVQRAARGRTRTEKRELHRLVSQLGQIHPVAGWREHVARYDAHLDRCCAYMNRTGATMVVWMDIAALEAAEAAAQAAGVPYDPVVAQRALMESRGDEW